jgi:DNA/RNA endonuclease YhcR with UshA esterase domain
MDHEARADFHRYLLNSRLPSWTALFLGILFASVALSYPTARAAELSAAEASRHIGETQTVCGVVASATYAARSRGQPTFLNLDLPYPNQIFTAVIWGSNRQKFANPPEIQYRGREICVSGVISAYRGKAQIEVHDPSQVRLASARRPD